MMLSELLCHLLEIAEDNPCPQKRRVKKKIESISRIPSFRDMPRSVQTEQTLGCGFLQWLLSDFLLFPLPIMMEQTNPGSSILLLSATSFAALHNVLLWICYSKWNKSYIQFFNSVKLNMVYIVLFLKLLFIKHNKRQKPSFLLPFS